MASHSHVKSPVRKLRINFCEEIDMRVLPGVGRKAAEQMSEFRRLHGNITTENVLGIPDVKVSRQFLQMVDFTRNHDYSSVPCRTNSRAQEHRTNTCSAVSWDEQSPENTPGRRPVYSPGAHRKSEGSPRARSSRKSYPVYPRERTSARRPAYSPGGTPARRFASPTEINPHRRSGYSQGSLRARSSRKNYPVYPRERISARRPAYSPGGTPSRRLAYSPEIYGIHRPAYSPGGTPARRQSPLRRPTCSRDGKSIKRRPVYSSENFQPRLLTFSSDDSSTDSQSDDSGDDSPARRQSPLRRPTCSREGKSTKKIRRACYYPPRDKPVRQTPSCTSEETSSSDSSTDEELVEGENHYERVLLASQTPDENLFEWADRVMILAGKAFRDTSESYRNRLSIRLFCQDCVDREAGQYALYHHPETLDRALDLIIHYVRSCRQKPWQASEANPARDLSNQEQRIAECQSPIMKSPGCDSTKIRNSAQSQSSIKKSPVCDSTKKQSSAQSQPYIKKSPVCDSTKKQNSAQSQSSIKKSPVCDSTKKQNSARSQASIKKSPVCDFRKEQNFTPTQPSINKSPVCDPLNSTEIPNTAGKTPKTYTQNRPSKKSKKAKAKKTKAKRTRSTDEHPSALLAVDKSLQKTVESTPQKEEIASSSHLDDCILQEAKEQKTGSEDSPLKATWKDSIYLNCPSRLDDHRMISTTAQISEEHSNSSLKVDELNGPQTNNISGEPVTTTNVLTDDIEEEAILKTGVDQKGHPDEDLSVILEIDSTCLVNGNTKGDIIISHVVDTEIHNQEKTVAELNKNEAVCTSLLQGFEETSSISDVHFDSGTLSVTEDGTNDSIALSFIEPPVILFGLKVRDHVVCNTSIEPQASTDEDGEIASPCWNISDFQLESTSVYKMEDLLHGQTIEKDKKDAEEQQPPIIEIKEDEILPSENPPIKEEIGEENLPSENSPIKEERKEEENLPSKNSPIKEERKEVNLPSENSPIKEEKKEVNLPSDNSPIKEEKKEENLLSENSQIKEEKREENLPSENSQINEEKKEENLPSENSPIKEGRRKENFPSENFLIKEEKNEENFPSENSPIKEEKKVEDLPPEKTPIKEDRKEENLPSENSLIKEEKKEENLPSENSPIKEERKEENLPSDNSPIKEDRKEENLPSENYPIEEDRKKENLPSENYPIEEDRKEENLPSYAHITGATEQTCLQTFWRGFLFLWALGVGYVVLLWHSLSLPYNMADASKGCSSTKDEEREEKNPEGGDICRAHFIGLNLPSVGVDQNGMETGHPEFVSTGNQSRDIDNNWATIDETGYMEMASLQTKDSVNVTDAVAPDQSEHDGGWEPDGETEQPVARQWDPGGKTAE